MASDSAGEIFARMSQLGNRSVRCDYRTLGIRMSCSSLSNTAMQHLDVGGKCETTSGAGAVPCSSTRDHTAVIRLVPLRSKSVKASHQKSPMLQVMGKKNDNVDEEGESSGVVTKMKNKDAGEEADSSGSSKTAVGKHPSVCVHCSSFPCHWKRTEGAVLVALPTLSGHVRTRRTELYGIYKHVRRFIIDEGKPYRFPGGNIRVPRCVVMEAKSLVNGRK